MLILTPIHFRRLTAWKLENEFLSLIVVPKRGGKIVSLRSKQSGKEWLYNSESHHSLLRCPIAGESFVEHYDTGGWDECFPSICKENYPCDTKASILIADHGVLWSQSWYVVNIYCSDDRVGLTLECINNTLAIKFQRSIWLDKGKHQFKLDYQIINLSQHFRPFIWSAHPIFSAESDMKIKFISGINTLKTDIGFQSFYQQNAKWVNTQKSPSNIEHEDVFSPSTLNVGLASKLYSPPLNHSTQLIQVALYSTKFNEQLKLEFSSEQISHFGLWLNYQGWSGNHQLPPNVIGLEPCIGGSDSLSEAMALGEVGGLSPSSSQYWSLSISIT